MSSFPLQIFTRERANVGFDDKYRSSILGRKFAGQPRGVYVGFLPRVLPASTIVSLDIDPTEGLSLAKLPSLGDTSGMDVYTTSNIQFDVGGIDAAEFPVNVIIRATYTDDKDTPTVAEVVTTSAAGGVSSKEVLVCVVSGPPSAPTVTFDPEFFQRDAPLALTGRTFGYMPAGSIEDLLAAVDAVNEVIAARIGLDGTVYDSLDERLVGDQSAEEMGERLATTFRTIRSNDYSIGAGVETLNVSSSFTEVDRDHQPLLTFSGLGSETTPGAVSDPADAVRNVCLIQDAITGYRPVDDPTDRRTIFGRLSGPETVAIAGTWTFTKNSQQLTGTGGTALSDFQINDTVVGPDGLLYEVITLTNNNQVTLNSAYRGDTTTSDSVDVNRWTLNLMTIVSGVETAASLPTPTTIRFFFPAFVTTGQSKFDYTLGLHTSSEKDPLPLATTSIPGRVTLADTNSRLGSITIQDAGIDVGQFHTLVFSSPSAVVTVLPDDSGSVEIVTIGPPGPTGPTGPLGATGPTGPTGPGFSTIDEYTLVGRFRTLSYPSLNSNSATINVGINARIVCANIERFQNWFGGGATAGTDIGRITEVTQATAGDPDVQVFYEIGGKFELGIFLTAAGD